MNSKIFFTDLDGTLLNDKKEITPGNRTAISEALSAGRPHSGRTPRIDRRGLLCHHLQRRFDL